MTRKTKISTEALAEKLLREEDMMTKSERTWSVQILRLTNYKEKNFETMTVLGNQMGQFHISWDSYLIPWDKMG